MSFKKEFMKPIEEKDQQKGFVKWGKKNDYPFFINDLVNGSALHGGIVKNKVAYICGGGFDIVSGGAEVQKVLNNSYTDFDFNELVQMSGTDYETYGGHIVKGSWSMDGSKVVKWEHLNIDECRFSPDLNVCYLSDDWSVQLQNEKTNFRTLNVLNLDSKSGSFFMYYKDPTKKAKNEKGVYPKPPYYSGISAINTDVNLSKYFDALVQSSFSAGTMITMPNGQPETQAQADKIINQIKGTSAGVDNAGEIIVNFSDGKDLAPIVQALSGNDLDKRYDVTGKKVMQNIFQAHGITTPSLFGTIQEGSFNAAESKELYQIWSANYISSRQNSLNWFYNYMLELSGVVGEIKLKDNNPFSKEVEQPQPSQFCAHSHQFNNEELELFAVFGVDAEQYEVLSSEIIEWETESEMVFNRSNEIFATIGEITASLTDFDRSLLKLLEEGQDATTIAKALKTDIKTVATTIAKMVEYKLIGSGKVTDLGKRLTSKDELEFEVRFKYVERPGNPPLKGESRDFCKRLLQLNRLYSRDEIETIGNRVDRNVWSYRGGYWTNADTGITTPYCRHIWSQQLIVKK